MKKQNLFAGVAAALVTAAVAAPASAQSIDYGSLESLFGEPVTTSATGSPQRSTEAPVDMTIISASDIKRSGAFDLPTIISRVAGIDVLNFAAGQSDIGVRGYNQARSPRLLVLINGRQVYLDHFGYTDWTSLPIQLSEIRQIEVVRGPNSAIFGFNAVSGVVNIITYNPKFDKANSLDVRLGTNEAAGVSVVSTFNLGDRLAVRLSGGNEYENEWKNTTTAVTRAMVHNPSTARANLDAILTLTPKAQLRVEGSYSNGSSTQVISTFAYAAHRVKTSSGKATLTAETPYGLMQAQVYQNELDALTPGRRYLNTITVASVEDLFKVGANHTFRVGLEYRDNSLDTASFEGAQVSYQVVAPSAMWNWAVNDKLSITTALRYDMLSLERSGIFPANSPVTSNAAWDRDVDALSANLGMVYKVTAKDTVRLTYARGVQAPTLLELGGLVIPLATGTPVGALITGDPNLDPAIVTNYQVGYSRDISSINGQVSAKLFLQKTEDVKGQFSTALNDIAPTATTAATYFYKNVADSEMTGVELAAKGKFGQGFHWSADVTYTDIDDKPFNNDLELVLRKVAFQETTPKYRGNAAAGWTDGKWAVDGFVHFVDDFASYDGNALEPVAAYATAAGRVGYRMENGLEFALSGQNLFNDRQAQAKSTTGLMAERRIMFAISKSW